MPRDTSQKVESGCIFQSEVMLCERQTDGQAILEIRHNRTRQFKVISLPLKVKFAFTF